MTPTAVTPAGRGAGAKAPAAKPSGKPPARTASGAKAGTRAGARAKASTARTAGHPGTIRKRTSPQVPRRVSGPLTRPARDRVEVRPARRPARRARVSSRTLPLHGRVASFVRSLPDRALLDRIIRGRAWIPLLGVMLAGIVAMQVEVLKLSSSMGRSIERSTALQSRNEILRASVAGLADDQRIERIAAGMGMLMPAPAGVDFLAARAKADVHGALAGIHQPNAAGFTALLPVTTTPGAGSSTTSASSSSGSATATVSASSSPAGSSTASSTAPAVVSGSGSSSQVASTPATVAPAASAPASSSAPVGQTSSPGQSGSSGGAAPVGG